MKIAHKFLFFIVLCTTICISQSKIYAKVYASQLRITNPDTSAFDGNFSDGSSALLLFILNDTASVATVEIIDTQTGSSIKQIIVQGLSRGLNSVEWDGNGSESGKSYTFEVTAEQPNASTSDWTVFFDSGDIDIFTRGCDVVRDMTSPLFGLFYVPNTGGGEPQEGKGIAIYNADGSFHDPFLVAKDVGDGGTVDWGGGTDAIYSGTFDDDERYYVTAANFGEIWRLNVDNSLTTVVSGLASPKGVYVTGSGESRAIYICDDSTVVRAAIGNEDVFSGSLEIVGKFVNGSPRNVTLDDDGAMYVSFRKSNTLDSDPIGLNKYDLSNSLPVTDVDAVWLLNATQTLRISDLLMDHGDDATTAADDILYYATRAGDGTFDDGLWRVDDISFVFPSVSNLIDEQDLFGLDDGANINDKAAIGMDAAGNVILMENSNEHIFFLSPPGEGETNSFTTLSPDTFTVGVTTSVELADDLTPGSYYLEANYPNPFNPSTTIKYHIAQTGNTSIKIYNLRGEEIKALFNESQASGAYAVIWNGTNNSGEAVASGVYIVTLKSGDFIQSRRVTLLK